MNKPERALMLADRDERLIALLAERVSERLFGDSGDGEDRRSLDVRAMLAALYRNRLLIATVIALALAAGAISILLTTPTYRARTTVQIEQQSARVLGTEDPEPVASPQEAERFLQTHVDIIKSRALAGRVVDSLGLAGDPRFLKAMGAKPLAEGRADMRSQREQAIGILQDDLSVSLPRNSRVVAIGVDSRSPMLAARIADSYAENLIVSNLQRRFETSSYSRKFLQQQLALAKNKLEQTERSLIAYSRSAGLIDASAGAPSSSEQVGPRSLTATNLVQLNEAYAQARSNRVAKQQRWQQAQATPMLSLPEVLGNPTIQQLSQQRAQLEGQYSQELQRRKEEHPALVQAKANIAELDRQVTTLAGSIRASIRDQYLVALRQEQALAGNVGQLKGETLNEQDRGVRYTILKREVETNRELYDGLLQRYKEVGAQAGITQNNISVIDSATVPQRPVSPQPLLGMALAALAGLALALLLVFLRGRFDDAIHVPEEIESKLRLPLAGVVPLVRGRQTVLSALASPRSAMADAQSALRSSVELSSPGGVPSSLLLTSSREGEGKSTTALGLARDLAQTGQRVLLVDADLRKPSLHQLLETANAAGLSSVLARQASADDVIRPTGTEGLMFMAAGPLPPNPAHLLSGAGLGGLLAQLAECFDVVVVDGPPMLGLADAPRLAAAVEGVLFVIEADGAHRGQAKAAIKRLLAIDARIVGAVLTKYDSRKNGFAYGYGYDYGAPPQLAEA